NVVDACAVSSRTLACSAGVGARCGPESRAYHRPKSVQLRITAPPLGGRKLTASRPVTAPSGGLPSSSLTAGTSVTSQPPFCCVAFTAELIQRSSCVQPGGSVSV